MQGAPEKIVCGVFNLPPPQHFAHQYGRLAKHADFCRFIGNRCQNFVTGAVLGKAGSGHYSAGNEGAIVRKPFSNQTFEQ
ncbi:MAG: hypothetical protein BWY09_01719 [Candidatus Hydrogenedentes bacterium ADurb.Bin179]|nr:MAG: hypothetical protein BWY09_01719 [Candidatus Hydrogenedentes bacterium ADurb.Bin179]